MKAKQFTESQHLRPAAALTTFEERRISQWKPLNTQKMETLETALKTKQTVPCSVKRIGHHVSCQVAEDIWGGEGGCMISYI